MVVTAINGYVGSSNSNPLEKCNGKETYVNDKTKQKDIYTKFTSVQNGHDVGAPPIPPLDRATISTEEGYERCSLLTSALTQLGFYLLLFLSYLNQMMFPSKMIERNRKGYAPLYSSFDQLYSCYIYRRGRHCFEWPVCSAPAEEITLEERVSDDYNWTFRRTGRQVPCVNLGSYNYGGYRGGKTEVETVTRCYGVSLCSPRAELGSFPLHAQLENELADFLGVEAAVVVGNGYLTNSLMLPGLLMAPGTLVLSDEKNHNSIIFGFWLAKACVRVFRHNDTRHLEQLAREARAEGRWEKIVVVLEGVYSMDGSLAALSEVIALKKHLGLHVYIDEAHSIGLGPRGRGATDACGVSARDVDAIMGSFSKSFPATGGYIAGSARLVNWLRMHGYASAYAQSMPPPIVMQMLCAIRDLRSPSGQTRVAALKDNARYFREGLREMGLVVHGHLHSPVVPVVVYSISKVVACVELLMAAGVAAACVAFPATPLYQPRVRFCLSAAHTREQLNKALAAIEVATDKLGLRYSRLKPKFIEYNK